MLLRDGPLTFQEFMTHEELPLATVFRAVLSFLEDRSDAVLFGAQAVNAWVPTARMTEDVDVLSTDASTLAEDLRGHLAQQFRIAVRVREVVPGGFRVYQVRQPNNRHLVKVCHVDSLPPHRRVDRAPVMLPAELAVMKVQAIVARRGRPKADTDRADLRRLLLACSELRTIDGEVLARLRELGASDTVTDTWRQIVVEPLEPDVDDY